MNSMNIQRTAGLLLIALILSGPGLFSDKIVSAEEAKSMTKTAAFAGGCFWGVEKIFMQISGVVSTQVGYAGGRTENPSYEDVCTGRTGHAEAVEIVYDPSKVSYEKLLLTFFQYHDPTTMNRQGPDVGSQYRSVIFYYDAEQKKAAERAVDQLNKAAVFKNPIVTEVVPAGKFWTAEDYHQKYLKKNPLGYCSHHFQSDKIATALKA